MRFYAETGVRRTRQIVGDLLVVAWTIVWIKIAQAIYHQVNRLGTPGRTLSSAGDTMASSMSDIGSHVSGVPFVGGQLVSPFNSASGAASDIADAGRRTTHAASTLATSLAWFVALSMIGSVLLVYGYLRWRYAREATAAESLRGSGAAADLFALRALTRRPVRILQRISPDPAKAWREEDEAVISALSASEMRRLGLRTRTASEIS